MTSLIQVIAVSLIAITVILVGIMPIYALYLAKDEQDSPIDVE